MNSNHTGRVNRTMNDAFGPHTSRIISEDEPLFDWDGICIIVGMTLLVASPYLFIAWRSI